MNTYKRNRRHSRRRDMRRWLAGASRGQAIVLLAVIMVVLIGFTGLAIDGGQLYFLRRDAQNAVDAAVLAGVYALCAEQDPVAPAMQAALDNGFNDAADDVSVTVTTPYDGDKDGESDDSDDDDYLQVIINASKPPKLIQLVYQGPLEVTVSGVGHCRPTREFTEVGAMFAGATGCSNKGASFSGSEVIIEGGIHTNSDLDLMGSSGNPNPSYVYGGEVTYGTGVSLSGDIYDDPDNPGNPISPAPGAADTPMPQIWNIADFRPGGEWATKAGNYVYIDGNLTSLDSYVTASVMTPGIYYVTGNIKPQTQDTNGLDASGVTWVAEGIIDISPKESTILSPYSAVGLPPMPLFFSNAGDRTCGVNQGIKVSASAVRFTGVFYAPNGEIVFSVSQGSTMDGALVGWIVNIQASNFELHYNPDLFPPIPPSGSLVE